jgi:hypothetical protein
MAPLSDRDDQTKRSIKRSRNCTVECEIKSTSSHRKSASACIASIRPELTEPLRSNGARTLERSGESRCLKSNKSRRLSSILIRLLVQRGHVSSGSGAVTWPGPMTTGHLRLTLRICPLRQSRTLSRRFSILSQLDRISDQITHSKASFVRTRRSFKVNKSTFFGVLLRWILDCWLLWLLTPTLFAHNVPTWVACN